jgi:hypothetical protein
MPITGFRWNTGHGCDIHILRNNQLSQRLDEFLVIREEFPAQLDPDGNSKQEFKTIRDINAGNSPPPEYFRALFIPSWQPRAVQNGSFLEHNGISVDLVTGQVKAVNVAGSLITSFFIQLILEAKPGQGLNLPPGSQPPTIAVHVHNNITKAWVTPATLTARPDVVKGISDLELKIASAKAIQKIVWRSDDTFQRNMKDFLLNANDPFDSAANFNQGVTFGFPPTRILNNRRHFPNNEVFKDPLHFEVTYVGEADPVRMTIPTHLPHLMQTGQTLADDAGNNVFEISRVVNKRQYRASVYAAFNDGTIGDLTINHGLTWDRGPGVNVNDITFDSDGAFEVAPSAVGKTLPIKATLPASFGPAPVEATGNVRVLQSWLNANPTAERLAGSPTNLPLETIPNVLFVSEGFTNKPQFQTAVLSLYDKLRNGPKTTPWNHLFQNRMNAWMLFEESRETAVTLQYENVRFDGLRLEDGTQADVVLPLRDLMQSGAKKVSDNAGLNIATLVFQVGLPLPADANAAIGTKTNEWKQLIDPNFGENVNSNDLTFSNDEFDYWKKLSNRTLIDERDTAWGLRCGEKPKVVPDAGSNIISFNEDGRLQRCNLDLFLSKVKDSASNALIGERLWGRDRQGKFGRDYGLVVFLVGGARTIGTRLSEPHFPQGSVNTGIGVGLVDNYLPLSSVDRHLDQSFPFVLWKRSANVPAIEMDPFPVLPDISIGASATVAHELSHSFNIDDEYSDFGRGPITPQIKFDRVYNLQPRSELFAGGAWLGDKVKWRWPRIKKAGVLEVVATQGPPISVTLRAGDLDQFEVNETVRLRKRDLLATPLLDLSSPPLKILDKNNNSRIITLELVDASTVINAADFGPTSLLYTPVKAPGTGANNPDGDVFAEVLSPMLRRRIKDSGPQTAEPCQDPEKGQDDQNPVNLPSDLGRPSEATRRRIVALFAGGKGFACDVFHASGECIMRKETFLETDRSTGISQRRTYQFCHVCRYALVDQIDPKQHLHIDKEYDGEYPLKDKGVALWIKLLIIGGLLGIVGYVVYERTKKPDQPS